MPSKATKSYKQQFQISIFIIIVLALLYYVKREKSIINIPNIPTDTREYSNSLERTNAKYSAIVEIIADDLDISYEYLMALIALETSGFVPAGSRFEKRVYKQLQNVKNGKLNRYENIKKKTIQDASDDALKNLATSWGPFQLMGYKCVGLEVNLHKIRSDSSVYYGAKWIKNEYGRILRKEDFEDAFHYHNTGRKVPRNGKYATHDPKYIPNGIKYMEYFRKNKP